jgi:K+-sensing histidine kinase KdpD
MRFYRIERLFATSRGRPNPTSPPNDLVNSIIVKLTLDNVADNAIRYSPTIRSLIVSARRHAGAIVPDVSDSVRGMPADEIDQVARKWFRGRHSFRTAAGASHPFETDEDTNSRR